MGRGAEVSEVGRPYGSGRLTCEACKSIDVRRWHREGRLMAGRYFSWRWTRDGEPSGNISVRSELDAVVLTYRWRPYGDTEWSPIEQRVPIAWTPCHFGGRRPWFVCVPFRPEADTAVAASRNYTG